jgi:hypothetical protein
MPLIYVIIERTFEGDRMVRVASNEDKAYAILQSYRDFPEVVAGYFIEKWDVEE